jgi:hypothetical protein
MSDQMIHGYTGIVSQLELETTKVLIDTDVLLNPLPETWESKQLDIADLLIFLGNYIEQPNGTWHDSANQTLTTNNQVKPVRFNTVDFNNGINVINDGASVPNIIKVNRAGVYNIQFSAQLYRTSGGSSQRISFWLRKNGNDIANSNTHVNVQANAGYLVASWNFFVECNINDEIQLMWTSTDTAIQMRFEAADLGIPHPATPSVILTVNKV